MGDTITNRIKGKHWQLTSAGAHLRARGWSLHFYDGAKRRTLSSSSLPYLLLSRLGSKEASSESPPQCLLIPTRRVEANRRIHSAMEANRTGCVDPPVCPHRPVSTPWGKAQLISFMSPVPNAVFNIDTYRCCFVGKPEFRCAKGWVERFFY